MKRIFNIVTLASLMAFAAACGKNESGGGGNKYENLGSNLSTSSIQAVDKFYKWYDSVSEGSIVTSDGYGLNYGNFELTRTSSTASNSSGCSVEDIEVFGVVIGQWYNCSNMNTSGSGGAATDCRISVAPSNKSIKYKNPLLKKIRENKMGQLVNATNSGTTYNFQYLNSDNTVVSYVINTQYHSALQPMQVTDMQNGTVTNLVQARGYNIDMTLPLCQ